MKNCRKWRLSKPYSLKKSDGKKYKRAMKQIKKRGFAGDETWDLCLLVAEFVLPRLKHFRKTLNGHPGYMTFEEWEIIVDKMIYAFEWTVEYDRGDGWKLPFDEIEKNDEKAQEGKELFGKHLGGLWN